MAAANPLWGAPRIHGERLKLGIEVAERTVSRLIANRRPPPSQTWRTFLTNHVQDLVSLDFFTVPTAQLRVLFVLVVLAHHRRRVLHFNVSEGHLRHLLTRYFAYYHHTRNHLSLAKDAPDRRPVEPPERGEVASSVLPAGGDHLGGAFRRLIRRAGLPHHRVYDLRHTYASLLLADGAPLTYVSAQLGHARPTTTLQWYARWIPGKTERFIEAPDDSPAAGRWHRLRTDSESGASDALEAPDLIGGPSRTRTLDPLIKSQLLYQLS